MKISGHDDRYRTTSNITSLPDDGGAVPNAQLIDIYTGRPPKSAVSVIRGLPQPPKKF